MNQCSMCDLSTTEQLPIMQDIGIGICVECYEQMDNEQIQKALFNVQPHPFEL